MGKDAKDNQRARNARADSLRERISELVSGGSKAAAETSPAEEAPAPAPAHESPRRFIERRMRELDQKSRKKPGKSSRVP